jgi:beta-lactamase superfamily II metal-dependent hydrolase
MDNPPEDPGVVFIDCGGGSIISRGYAKRLSRKDTYPGKRLRKLFKNIRRCEMFITHNHKDHFNLCGTIKRIGSEVNKNIAASKIIRPLEGVSKEDESLLKKDKKAFSKSLSTIENALGPRVRIVPMRPEMWEKSKIEGSIREHDFNIMYLVEFAGRRILFTGDVSPQLFTQIMNNPKYAREIKRVDFLVLPHHGSNRSGELLTFPSIVPEMCIVCGNPEEKDHLPWKEVGNLPFKGENGITTLVHRLDTSQGEIETNMPVFVTHSAKECGYYELVIEADGTVMLFDGPSDERFALFRSL